MSGVQPEVIEVPGDEPPNRSPEPVAAIPGPADQAEEPEVEEVDLSEDDLADGDSLFSGTEEAGGTDSTDSGHPDDGGPFSFDDPANAGQLETAIVEGAARLAVVGLEDDEADELEAEFVDVFEAFQLGHFGSECVDRYVLVGEEHLHPAWGLLGAALVCSAFALYMRPDGDEKARQVREAIGSLATGIQQGATA